MPSESQHKGKTQRNRNFLNSIIVADFPEWVCVAAVQSLFRKSRTEALGRNPLVRKGLHPSLLNE